MAADVKTDLRSGRPPQTACRPWTRDQIAANAARDIPEGSYVNIGIGIPVLVANHVPAEREVIIHSENGILGMGPEPGANEINRWLINASKKYVTLRPGGAYMHHADSFGIIRGGHLDFSILGAFQVAENGDFANWSMSATDMPSVGGAMDLAVGAKQVWVLMDHATKSGESKLVRRCTYPLTAPGAVTRVYTNLAVLDVTAKGFAVREMAPGLTFEALQEVTGAPLHRAA
jgi:3-oxoadipate CoA-transferase, beta subunit